MIFNIGLLIKRLEFLKYVDESIININDNYKVTMYAFI